MSRFGTQSQESDEVLEAFRRFLPARQAPEREILVVNWEGPEQVRRLLEEAFGSLPVELEERNRPEMGENLVVLVDEGEVVATSSLESLQQAVLLVNVDLYRRGLSGIDKYEAPDVLTAIDERLFSLRGFPASTKEKLLLVVILRFIEKRALEAGEGRLDVAFQELSHMDDEYGTEKVYQRLADSDLEVHVYGVPDTTPEVDGITVHAGRAERYRRSWFVVFQPPPGEEPAALLAVETGPNEWDSMWTYDCGRVDRLGDIIETGF
jgi:hypothetical protein